MCFNEDAFIFLPSLLLYTSFQSLSLSLFFAVRLTANKCSDVHLFVVWPSRKKSSIAREEKKKIETTNYTMPLKKRSEKRTRHTSASSMMMIFADNQRYIFINKTMTWTFLYVRTDEITHTYIDEDE